MLDPARARFSCPLGWTYLADVSAFGTDVVDEDVIPVFHLSDSN